MNLLLQKHWGGEFELVDSRDPSCKAPKYLHVMLSFCNEEVTDASPHSGEKFDFTSIRAAGFGLVTGIIKGMRGTKCTYVDSVVHEDMYYMYKECCRQTGMFGWLKSYRFKFSWRVYEYSQV